MRWRCGDNLLPEIQQEPAFLTPVFVSLGLFLTNSMGNNICSEIVGTITLKSHQKDNLPLPHLSSHLYCRDANGITSFWKGTTSLKLSQSQNATDREEHVVWCVSHPSLLSQILFPFLQVTAVSTLLHVLMELFLWIYIYLIQHILIKCLLSTRFFVYISFSYCFWDK